jgi:hypothetical protein
MKNLVGVFFARGPLLPGRLPQRIVVRKAKKYSCGHFSKSRRSHQSEKIFSGGSRNTAFASCGGRKANSIAFTY